MDLWDVETAEGTVARIGQITARREWPWMHLGELSVGLDEEGRVARYLATETGLVPVRNAG